MRVAVKFVVHKLDPRSEIVYSIENSNSAGYCYTWYGEMELQFNSGYGTAVEMELQEEHPQFLIIMQWLVRNKVGSYILVLLFGPTDNIRAACSWLMLLLGQCHTHTTSQLKDFVRIVFQCPMD
ncbi:hypothetical protein C5167_022762 [Papaver somniferum]|uniref:Uncharacterized protein n=1 Tax=Papaver somniferum TaxID=3469 RepID=A0A4Y7JMJ5_PAPSO|nr:hypothetical protein C5167_022762 [Papaver somniferum]